MFHFIVDVFERSNLNAMSDAVLLCKPAGIYQAALRFGISQGEAKVDPGTRSRFDLGEDVIAIKRNYRLTGTRLRVFADAKAKLQQLVVEWPQFCLGAGEHRLDVPFGGLKIRIRIADLGAFTIRAFG